MSRWFTVSLAAAALLIAGCSGNEGAASGQQHTRPTTGEAAPCTNVVLTGTKGGPAAVDGIAGVGTLVQVGDETNGCSAINLQFDAGRATSLRLSEIPVTAGQIDALFLTHVHSDHTDGISDLMQLRWHYESDRPKLDVVCAADTAAPDGHVNSCTQLMEHIADPFIASGEIGQRHGEREDTPAEGPAALAAMKTFTPTDQPEIVWQKDDVTVSAVGTTHTAGHASYRVDTPSGSVVISGDASNDKQEPPRDHSTSDQLEAMAQGADVLVHATTHPNMGPEEGGGMPERIFYRQSIAPDIGAMAERAEIPALVLTHLTPSLGEVKRVDGWHIPDAPLTAEDFEESVRSGGYEGEVIVGRDLDSVHLPLNE